MTTLDRILGIICDTNGKPLTSRRCQEERYDFYEKYKEGEEILFCTSVRNIWKVIRMDIDKNDIIWVWLEHLLIKLSPPIVTQKTIASDSDPISSIASQ